MPQRPLSHHEPQLRIACDACNTAKVKCSQDRPECKRCEAREVPCQYSVSLRSKRKGRPSTKSNTSITPSAASSTTTSGNQSSSETSNDIFMSPVFDNNNTIPAIFEDWNPGFTSQTLQQLYPDPSETNFPPFPNFANIQSNEFYEELSPSRFSNNEEPSPQPLLPMPSSSHSHISTAERLSMSRLQSAASCECQQKILRKLSVLSHLHTIPDQSLPFDESLSENRSIIALCTSIINCTNRHHDNDIVLMLTHMALLTHVVTAYDQTVGTNYQSIDGSDDDAPFAKRRQVRKSSGQRLCSKNGESCARVRLSLGSYELDHRDEQLVQGSLLKIHLSKVKTLIEGFEKRFHHVDWDNDGGVSHEGKPLGEIISWLNGRLRMNYKALAHSGAGARD